MGRVGGAIAFIVVNALLVRLLPLEDVGYFYICFALVTAFSLIAQMGMGQVVVKLVGEANVADRRRIPSIVLWTMGATVAGALLCSAVFLLGADEWVFRYAFDAPELSNMTILVCLWLIASAVQNYIAEVFRGFHDIRVASLIGGNQSGGVLSLLLVIMVWLMLDTFHVVISLELIISTLVLCIAIIALVGAFLVWKRVGRWCSQKKLESPKVFLLGAYMLGGNIFTYILIQADLWIVGAMATPEDLAVYAAASRLAVMIGLPLMIFNSVIPPIIAEMYSQNRTDALERMLRFIATIASMIAFPVLIVCMFFGKELLYFIYSEDYMRGWLILLLLGAGKYMHILAGSCGWLLMMTQHQSALLKISIISSVIAIVGGVLSAKLFGIEGVAAAFALTMLVQNILILNHSRKQLGIVTYVCVIRFRDFRRYFHDIIKIVSKKTLTVR